jgi:hypothetical protein
MALRKFLILRRPRSGRLEGRAMPIQHLRGFPHTLLRGNDTEWMMGQRPQRLVLKTPATRPGRPRRSFDRALEAVAGFPFRRNSQQRQLIPRLRRRLERREVEVPRALQASRPRLALARPVVIGVGAQRDRFGLVAGLAQLTGVSEASRDAGCARGNRDRAREAELQPPLEHHRACARCLAPRRADTNNRNPHAHLRVRVQAKCRLWRTV